MSALLELIKGDTSADKIVPPTGFTALLTLISAAAMAFLAVFVVALALSAGRQAASWDAALDGTATVRISGAPSELPAQVAVVETILSQTPGIGATRRITDDEQRALLAPWFGPDTPVEALALPVLIEVTLDSEGPDAAALSARFAADAPGAAFDDHGRWRQPLVDAADGLRRLAWTALILIFGVTATTIALAAAAALSANGQVIDVLRLVGAEDSYITRAFVRRFTLRALIGGATGALLGLVAVILIPNVSATDPSSDIRFTGAGWLWPAFLPFALGAIAFVATRFAAARRLREVS